MKRRYVLISMTIFTVLGLLVSFFAFNKTDDIIDRILRTSAYSYLPNAAKEFIADAYHESGTIILTEKNKEDGKAYLNPKYVEYLAKSDEEKRNVAVIPEALSIDWDYSKSGSSIEAVIPTKYDLRDTDNNPSTTNTYITDLKNQGSLNVCWAIASTEIAESNLMVTGNKPNQTLQFSPRQMDYALSRDGISNYGNMHGVRDLGTGGNFSNASYAMVNGISLVNETTMPFNTSYNTLKYHEVFNYSNSLYEVNKTTMPPQLDLVNLDLSNSADLTKKMNYLALIKTKIMNYGGAYIATESPNHSCAFNNNGTYLIRVDGKCTMDSAHAMQIIGWDDSYSYKYCNTDDVHKAWTSSCPAANTVSGTGAWLVRNSWGNTYSYVYIAYESFNSEIGFVEKMASMSNKKWQNNYHTTPLYNGGYYAATGTSTTFVKRPKVNEVVEAVKLFGFTVGGSYKIEICNTESSCVNVGNITSDYPGYNTIDVSSKNINLTNDTFTIKVTGNSSEFLVNSVSVFTHNASSTVSITTDLIESTGTGAYEFPIQSYTKNIPDGATVTYKLYNSKGTDVTSYMQVANNKVTLNEVHGAININPSVGTGEYTLKASYGGSSFSSRVLLNGTSLSGSGTEADPFIIDSVPKLKLMDNNHAYYKLTTDLDISSYTGTYEGIQKFSGVFDGNNHVIKNGTSSLINTIYGNSNVNVTIKNLILENFNYTSSSASGILANTLYDNGYNVNIQNVAIIGGNLKTYSNAGALVGKVYASTSNKINFKGIYSSATINGSVSSGIVGSLYHEITTDNIKVNFNNIQNVGYIPITNNNAGYIVGTAQYVIPVINGFIVTGKVSTSLTSNNALIGSTSVPETIYNSTITNGYYANGARSVPNITGKYPSYTNGAVKKAGYEITSLTDINSFPSYATYWEAKTVDGITRMPNLKIASKMQYTKIKTISVKEGNTVSIFDYITPKIDAAKNIVTTSNNTSVATIDSNGTISGVAAGATKIKVKSNYDGYVGDVIVNVLGSTTVTVTFNANGGSGVMEKMTVTKGKNAYLPKNIFTKKGYVFNGWNTKADGTGTNYADGYSFTTISSSLTLYAKWTPINYTISYNVNGGSGSVTSTSMKYDVSKTLPNGPTAPTGKKFVLWNTKANGTGTSYKAGQSVSNLTTTNGTNIVLYAIYEDITYKIYYDYVYNGNSKTVSVKYNSDYTIMQMPIYREYEFLSWNTKKDGTGITYNPGTTVSKLTTTDGSTITLYAIWGTTKVWTIKNYTYNNKYIEKVVNNTNITNYAKNFSIASGYELKVYNGSTLVSGNNLIGTGMVTRIVKNNKTVAEFINIIRGDINGDGKVTSADYILIRKHIMETEKITADYKVKSADINNDVRITSADYILVRKYIMNGGTL